MEKRHHLIYLVHYGTATGRQMYAKQLMELRLEPWEIAAVRRLSMAGEAADPHTADLSRLYATSSALRVKLDDEARELLKLRDARQDPAPVLAQAERSLGRAREYDERFQWFLDEALYAGAGEEVAELYRSKFRLVRSLSGLWLLYNQLSGSVPGL